MSQSIQQAMPMPQKQIKRHSCYFYAQGQDDENRIPLAAVNMYMYACIYEDFNITEARKQEKAGVSKCYIYLI